MEPMHLLRRQPSTYPPYPTPTPSSPTPLTSSRHLPRTARVIPSQGRVISSQGRFTLSQGKPRPHRHQCDCHPSYPHLCSPRTAPRSHSSAAPSRHPPQLPRPTPAPLLLAAAHWGNPHPHPNPIPGRQCNIRMCRGMLWEGTPRLCSWRRSWRPGRRWRWRGVQWGAGGRCVGWRWWGVRLEPSPAHPCTRGVARALR